MTPDESRITAAGAMVRVELPWPSSKLSPNARVHWAPKSAATKKARMDAFIATLEVKLRDMNASAVTLTTTFYPPDRRRYDDDNLMARCKAYFDGIADAMRLDDSNFRHGAPRRGEVRKGGKVEVGIERQSASSVEVA